jgi:integrase
MTALAREQCMDGPLWHWPLSVEQYDRAAVLFPAEQEVLSRLIHGFDAGNIHWHPQAEHALVRLLRPLYTVLDYTAAPEPTRSRTIILLLREMHHRGRSFWAWSRETWVELIGYNAWTFRQGHRRSGDLRPQLMAVAYLLTNIADLHLSCHINHCAFARKIFGAAAIEEAVGRVSGELRQWGHGAWRVSRHIEPALSAVLLLNRSPHLEDLTLDVLRSVRQQQLAAYLKRTFVAISQALTSLNILPKPLERDIRQGERFGNPDAHADVPPEWLAWVQRWCNTSTLAPRTRQSITYQLLKIGRWLGQTHPTCVSPTAWTREVAAEYVAAVDRMTVGEWAHADKCFPTQLGKPLTPRAKAHQLAASRVFFTDLQEWGLIPRAFDPRRCLATPRSMRALIAPDPRVIADDIWAKLLWAGLNLRSDDLPRHSFQAGAADPRRQTWYPLEMVRALVMVWLFAGLRSDEIVRLRLGCIRWQRNDGCSNPYDEGRPKEAVCLLDVPTHKTGTAFSKPVDHVVGEAIEAWQQLRPSQPSMVDAKTAEVVAFLFCYRGKRVGKTYLNTVAIPMLCRKAGIAEQDARGPITSHRARSTIASQLFNAREPMSLFELQAWLGHRSPESTQHYAKITPTRLTKAFQDAEYFARNVRTIEVLIDQAVVVSGEAAQGLAWKYYDLGHGYCTYDFFEQCEHRMACAQCAFYRPKAAFGELLEEKREHLLRMKQDIPLTELELATVEGDLVATERLIAQLRDVPTPSGRTPGQLQGERRGEGGEGGAGEGVGA